MGMKLTYNAVNQAEKGTVIYNVKEPLTSICMIVKGRILAVNNGSKVLLGSGSFFGISELNVGYYINTYIAYDDVTFYCFPIQRFEDLVKIFALNKDYRGLMTASMAKYFSELDKIYQSLTSYSEQLYQFIRSNYTYYIDMGERMDLPQKLMNDIESLAPFETDLELDDNKLEFYRDSAKVTLEGWKSFCGGADTIPLYFVGEMAELIVQLTSECDELVTYMVKVFESVINGSNNACLFKRIAFLILESENAGAYSNDLIKILDSIIEEINLIEQLFDEKVGIHLEVDRTRMEDIYFAVLSKESSSHSQEEGQSAKAEDYSIFEDMNKSLSQIVEYGQLDKEKENKLELLITEFKNLKDKHAADDSTRILRKQLSDIFYELYEKVFMKGYDDPQIPKAADLFLKYGYLDEALLNKSILKTLYFLENAGQNPGPCKVYNMKQWLTEIYKGNKEPSKNEFDLDYRDMLREDRKRGKITEDEEKQLLVNPRQKVIYEIRNMFRTNHRLVGGQISTFVPFLYKENILQDLNNLYVTANRLNTEINEILKIDYSVFHREILYVNNEKGIEKEYIMKQVFPDIILMPGIGYNGIMWQELSDKRKSKEGRFLLPSFTEASLKELLIKILGRYRWELCRTIQGSAWNNIKYKSLTSEYADYIQFYRKNRDLSEEVKEKVKNQIQKGRNNYREIFLIDYEGWIKNESAGGLRLNKVARELLATYCPFTKSIRERLSGQPLFSDAMARFERNNIKKVRDLELRYRALEKDSAEITEELMETLLFYRDL